MKSRTQFCYFVGLSALCLSLISCGGNNREVAVRGDTNNDGSNNPNKPIPAVPPQFDTAQFKVGNYIEWTATSANGATSCIKWTITAVRNTHAEIKLHKSPDCKTYSPEFFELIAFGFEDGVVVRHEYVYQGKGEPAPPEVSLSAKQFKLFDHFYKNPNKVSFTIGTDLLGGKVKYPVFRLSGGDRIYYKGDTLEPVHPWHAVILKFRDTSKPSNLYIYRSADPALVGVTD